MSRATWNPGADLAGPLSNQEPTEYDVVELFAGDEQRTAAAMAIIAATPQHRYRALADQRDRVREWFAWWRSDAWPDACSPDDLNPWAGILLGDGSESGQQRVVDMLWNAQRNGWPAWDTLWKARQALPNLMIGTTIRTQADADEKLAELPAAFRFVRVEPSEAIDLSRWITCPDCEAGAIDSGGETPQGAPIWIPCPSCSGTNKGTMLDLVEFAGGASPGQLGYIQDLASEVLDAQTWMACEVLECVGGAIDCPRCDDLTIVLESGRALAIVAESTDPAKVSPVVDIPGHGRRSWNQQPVGWRP